MSRLMRRFKKNNNKNRVSKSNDFSCDACVRGRVVGSGPVGRGVHVLHYKRFKSTISYTHTHTHTRIQHDTAATAAVPRI